MAPINRTEIESKGFDLVFDGPDSMSVCYFQNITCIDGLWKAENPLVYSLHKLVLQLVLILFLNHTLMFLLRRLRQPRIVADILAGILLGPSFLGSLIKFTITVTPFNTLLTLETVANLGLVYYMFLLGLELDFRPVIRSGKKALCIAVTGVVVSVPVGWALHYYVQRKTSNVSEWDNEHKRVWIQGPMFWGIALATTNFADLARILADLKLLHSEIGRLALSAAVISDMFAGFLFIMAMTFISVNLWSVGFTLAFIVVFVFIVRPALSWALRYTPEKVGYNEFSASFVLTWILICGFITDVCGAHSILGAFVFGTIMPKELELRSFLVERIGNFVSSIMMPLFYLVVGLRFDVRGMFDVNGTAGIDIFVVVVLAFMAKILATFIAALINKMSFQDSMVLGVLMNTKGLLALIILSSGRDLKVLDSQMYTMMLIVVLGNTIPVGPFMALTYKSSRRSPQYKLKNIPSVETNSDFRILVCNHISSNTSGMIELIEASNPSEQSPIQVFAVNLVELTNHASAMLIVHDTYKSANEGEQSNPTFNEFETYASPSENVSVQALTIVSRYNTMHEDICTLAEDKNVNLIIIPFHKKSTIDDEMLEGSNPSFLGINKSVMKNSSCSVCIFVDRGLATCKLSRMNNKEVIIKRKFFMLFLGGIDDREALGYAWRMAGHYKVHLTVIRLTIPTTSSIANSQWQKQLDDADMEEFRLKTINNCDIQLFEEQINSWEDIHNLISSTEGEYALCIVGRDHGRTLSFKNEASVDYEDDYDEVGELGEALVSSRHMRNTSILIIKHSTSFDKGEVERKMGHVEEQSGHTIWQTSGKNTTNSVIETENL